MTCILPVLYPKRHRTEDEPEPKAKSRTLESGLRICLALSLMSIALSLSFLMSSWLRSSGSSADMHCQGWPPLFGVFLRLSPFAPLPAVPKGRAPTAWLMQTCAFSSAWLTGRKMSSGGEGGENVYRKCMYACMPVDANGREERACTLEENRTGIWMKAATTKGTAPF
jgi:hypothetical protein